MKTYNVEVKLEVEFFGIPFEAYIKGTYRPGDPGKISGPPEKCYPPEPDEFEASEVVLYYEDSKGTLTRIEIEHKDTWEFIDQFQEEIMQKARDEVEDYEPSEY